MKLRIYRTKRKGRLRLEEPLRVSVCHEFKDNVVVDNCLCSHVEGPDPIEIARIPFGLHTVDCGDKCPCDKTVEKKKDTRLKSPCNTCK